MSTVEKIKEEKIVAVIRHANQDNILSIVNALHEGGVNVIELTAETPMISQLLEMVIDEFGRDVLVGIGSVLDPETARIVLMAGAQFIVTPALNPETIKLTNKYGVLTISGALTPTEILTAFEHGAGIVKVFPANIFGLQYIKDIQGPLPHIPMMVTGGINKENYIDYLKQGCVAVGLGTSLVNAPELVTKTDYKTLTNDTRQLVGSLASL